MKKIGLTLTLVLFFILGFIFKHYFDFKFLTKLNTATKNQLSLSSQKQNQQPLLQDNYAQIGNFNNISLNNIANRTIFSSPQNIPSTGVYPYLIDPSADRQQVSPSIRANAAQQTPTMSISDIIYAQENERSLNSSYASPNQNPNFLPIRDWSIPFIEVSAKSAIITDQEASKIFYQKNIAEKLPIASLTKIMTAIAILENKSLNEVVKISKTAVSQQGEAGSLVVDEEITIDSLLKALLIESSNDAAYALEEHLSLSGKNLIDLMNKKAELLELKNTHFSSSSGLKDSDNYSTTLDLARLIAYSLNNEYLWKILKMPTAEITSVNKLFNHRLINSNQLFGKIPDILGGKTGYTDEALGCLLIAVAINSDTKIISVVLGSNDRFGETEKLINWVKSAYRF